MVRLRALVFLGVAVLAVGLSVNGSPPASASSARFEHATFAIGHGNHVYAYWTRDRSGVPWVVNVHGGYWHSGSGRSPHLVAWGKHEQARGYAAFAVDYRLVPTVHWPTPETDVQAAITWIRAHARHFGLGLGRGFIIGGSAGGLLASVAALDDGSFAGVVTMAGAVDPYWEYWHDPNRKLRQAALALLGFRTPAEAPAAWASARAVDHLGRHDPPFLVMQAAHDRTVNIATGVRFAEALRTRGYRVTFAEMPGHSHLLDQPADTAVVDAWMANILATR